MWSILMNSIGLLVKDLDDIYFEIAGTLAQFLEDELDDILDNFDGSAEEVRTSMDAPLNNVGNSLTRPSNLIPSLIARTVDTTLGPQNVFTVADGTRIVSIGMAAQSNTCSLFANMSTVLTFAEEQNAQSLQTAGALTPTSFEVMKSFGGIKIMDTGFTLSAMGTGYVNVVMVFLQEIGATSRVS